MIREELPQQIRSRGPSYVSDVGCVETGDASFECLATIHAASASGRLLSERVAITASCDGARCIWRTIR